MYQNLFTLSLGLSIAPVILYTTVCHQSVTACFEFDLTVTFHNRLIKYCSKVGRKRSANVLIFLYGMFPNNVDLPLSRSWHMCLLHISNTLIYNINLSNWLQCVCLLIIWMTPAVLDNWVKKCRRAWQNKSHPLPGSTTSCQNYVYVPISLPPIPCHEICCLSNIYCPYPLQIFLLHVPVKTFVKHFIYCNCFGWSDHNRLQFHRSVSFAILLFFGATERTVMIFIAYQSVLCHCSNMSLDTFTVTFQLSKCY